MLPQKNRGQYNSKEGTTGFGMLNTPVNQSEGPMKSNEPDLFVRDITKPCTKIKPLIDIASYTIHVHYIYRNGGYTYISQPGAECLM